MNHFASYFLLLTFPVSRFVALNPSRFWWGFQHGMAPMPPAQVERTENIDGYTSFAADVLMLVFLVAIVHGHETNGPRLGLHFDEWKRNITIGAIAGSLRLASVSTLKILLPGVAGDTSSDYWLRGSLARWVFFLLVGAFAEELWIALCLNAFRQAFYPVMLSIGLVTVVFGVLHYRYGVGGILAQMLWGAASCLLFLWTQSLFATCTFHFIGNLTVLYWLRTDAQTRL